MDLPNINPPYFRAQLGYIVIELIWGQNTGNLGGRSTTIF